MDVVDKIIELTELFDDNVVTTADKINRPEPKQSVKEIELFNEFNKRNPMAGGGMLVQPGFGGTRQGYKEDRGKGEYKRDSLSKIEQKKIKKAFPDTKFNFDRYRYGVKKYPDLRNQNKTNKDYTKVLRFIKKGFTKEMGEGLNVRGQPYSVEGKRLSLKDQEKIKSLFKLPPGEEWDFKTHKYGIKQAGRENLLVRMAKAVKDKKPWKVAADFGSTEGWMILQMNRVFENETKAGVKPNKLTYQPQYKIINGRKRIIGFKDNTVAGGGKYYYGLNIHAKKNATNFINHGDFKLNQKLVDISKRSFNQPNEVITGLLKEKGFTGKINLNQLINYLAGTEATSAENLKNAVVRHHNSGVAFGSATNDLSLTTQTINNKIKGIEGRIANNIIKPEDINILKNNNIFVKSPDGKLYGAGAKTPIGQFKQIEKGVETAVRSPDFNVKGLKNFMSELGIKCQLSTGINCMNVKAYEKSLNELSAKAQAGDNVAQSKLLEFGKKTAKAGRVIKNVLGPYAIATEVALGVPLGLYGYAKGQPLSEIANTLSYGLAGESQDERLKKEMPDYGAAQNLDKVFERLSNLERLEKGTRGQILRSKPKVEQVRKDLDFAIQPFIRVSPQTESGQFLDPDLYMRNIFKTAETKTADEEAMKEKALERKTPFDLSDPFMAAGGGIAKQAGVPSGPAPESGPNSQGLPGLIKRVNNL